MTKDEAVLLSAVYRKISLLKDKRYENSIIADTNPLLYDRVKHSNDIMDDMTDEEYSERLVQLFYQIVGVDKCYS